MMKRFKTLEVKENMSTGIWNYHIEIYIGDKVKEYDRPIKSPLKKDSVEFGRDLLRFALDILNGLANQPKLKK